eukprot:COSAG06_NODE_69600_length_197_cov_16.459184_1_plen_41_part_01
MFFERACFELIYDKKNNINEMIITIIGFQEEETASKNQTEP